MRKIILLLFIFLLIVPFCVFAHKPNIIYHKEGDILIENPEVSQAFYDELKGETRNYFIRSDRDFNLYINILVPNPENRNARYFANVYDKEKVILATNLSSADWIDYYEEFGRDWYLKGPEFEKELPAGEYKIEIFSEDNLGKYVLVIGKTEAYDAKSFLNIYWQLPLLKINFFKTSPLEFFLTPFGIIGVGAIGAVLIFLAIIYYLTGVIKEAIKHKKAKTLLLTSAGMAMKNEIIKLLQKPSYDINVAFITTALKPEAQENQDYTRKNLNLRIMRDEVGFNVEEFDIEGKTEHQIMRSLEFKDIIFVEGGNIFYLLKAMRLCNFRRVIKKLLKQGKVYVGASEGSIIAGKTIRTAIWEGRYRNIVNLKNLKGLNLVPFDIFVHYRPEHAEIIKKKLPRNWQRKKIKIITDEQAILVQGGEVFYIGRGEKVVV